jgi:DNA-binding CsgD family transcriptional regulator
MARSRAFVLADLRGSGLADRHPRSFTFDDQVQDIRALCQAVSSEAVDLLAFGPRGSQAIRLAVSYPHLIRRLYLWAAPAGPFANDGIAMASPSARRLMEEDWELYEQLWAARQAGSEEAVTAMVQFSRACTDRLDVLAFIDSLDGVFIEDDPAGLACPALVTELDGTTLRDERHAARLSQMIPESELVYLPNRPLYGWVDELADAIERFDAVLDAEHRNANPDGSLSKREAEVLRLVASGHTNSEIASALSLSRTTVERHVANIYAKLNVRNRSEATRWALTHGLDPAT